MVTGWYFWWYLPLQNTCQKTTARITELSQRNSFLSQHIQQKIALELQKAALDKKIQYLAQTSKINDYAMIDTLLTALKRYDISCKELKPLPIKQEVFWQNHPFNLVFRGNFKSIKLFMHDFFAQQKYASCNKLSLVRWKNHEIKGELNVSFITFGEHEKNQ